MPLWIEYWIAHQPDLSDLPTISPESLQFYARNKKGRSLARHAHNRSHKGQLPNTLTYRLAKQDHDETP